MTVWHSAQSEFPEGKFNFGTCAETSSNCAIEVRPLSVSLSVFRFLALVDGDNWNRGDGGTGGRGREPGRAEGKRGIYFRAESGSRNLKNTHSYFVYNCLSSSFKTSSYLTSTDALKILSWARKCKFILRLIKQHSLSSNRIPIEFGYTIGHEWSDINCVQICQCLANCSRQNSSAHKASRLKWL